MHHAIRKRTLAGAPTAVSAAVAQEGAKVVLGNPQPDYKKHSPQEKSSQELLQKERETFRLGVSGSPAEEPVTTSPQIWLEMFCQMDLFQILQWQVAGPSC